MVTSAAGWTLVVIWFSLLHGGYDRSETPYSTADKCWLDAVALLNKGEPRVADAFCRQRETIREELTPDENVQVDR